MRSSNRHKGLILVTVLWVVVLLGGIVATIGRASLLDLKMRGSRVDSIRCKWACKGGVEKAAAVLNEDLTDSDSFHDYWHANAVDFNDIILEGCSLTVKVVDEASKLNINTATFDQLMEFEGMTEEVANSILDWRDGNDEPRIGGAEGGYYESLHYGYRIRNGMFRTIRELLLVKGVTEDLLYGEDTNLNGVLDHNEKDKDQSWPLDNGDDKLDQGWIAYFTCYSYDRNISGDGARRLNINNANQQQLEQNLGLSSSHAKWIVEKKPNNGYESIADLIDNKSPAKPSSQSGSDSNSDQAEKLDIATYQSIVDYITVDDSWRIQGRVNINTAGKEVIKALFAGSDDAEQLAESIVSYRQSQLAGMLSIGELLDADGISVDDFKKIADDITVRSEVFTVKSTAVGNSNRLGSGLVTEAVIDRSRTPYRVYYWYQGVSN
jgi:type II secretory pathway component PulK